MRHISLNAKHKSQIANHKPQTHNIYLALHIRTYWQIHTSKFGYFGYEGLSEKWQRVMGFSALLADISYLFDIICSKQHSLTSKS